MRRNEDFEGNAKMSLKKESKLDFEVSQKNLCFSRFSRGFSFQMAPES